MSKTRYVIDTNVLVRFLVGDVEEHQKKAEQLFERALEKEIEVVIKPIVVADTCFVLESFYKLERDRIAVVIQNLLGQFWINVEERDVLLMMWRYYRRGLHFVDSYLLAWSQSNKAQVYSFDKELMSLTVKE